jgi:serine/threonine-protein kinase
LQAALGDTYSLEREITGGGMSRLFLATERSLNRRVVIKLLPPELTDAASAQRFGREIDTLARLQHPHVLPILTAGASEGLAYYVMPHVEGESLRARLTRDGRLPVADAVRLMTEAADALGYAHRHGVVHRDVKPENILLSDGHALLADFGIARAVARSGASLTGSGVGIGTPGYMSPEQAAGEPDVDARSDLYALAVVGYEMLTGRRPFAGSTATAELAAHMRDTPVAPRAVRGDVPRVVSDAIVRGLAKEPDERFQSAQSFRDALSDRRHQSALSRRTIAAGLALAAAGVAAIAVPALRRESAVGGESLDSNVVAVAPINVLAPDLALWREGIVDVIARNLDGAGRLRTVAPSAAIRGFPQTADASSGDALARRTGAGIVLYGTLQRTRGDSVRFTATVRDAKRGNTRGDIDRSEAAVSMDLLADSVSLDVLRLLIAGAGGENAARLRSVGTRSLPALKEFLQGQRFYRSVQYDSAEAHFRRAVAIDSSFALAYHAMASARGWVRAPGVGSFSQARPYALRAVALNRRLGARDSMFIAAESLYYEIVGSTPPALPPANNLLRGRRQLLASTRQLAQQYPSDAEVLYRDADVRYHLGGVATGDRDDDVFETFSRAIHADSAFGPVYGHAIALAGALHGLTLARQYAEARARHASATPEPLRQFREALFSALRAGDHRALETLVDTANINLVADAVLPSAGSAIIFADSAPVFIRALARAKPAAATGTLGLVTPAEVERRAATVLVSLGLLESAVRLPELENTPAFVVAAQFGAVREDSARAAFGRWIDEARPSVTCVLAMEWWAARRDTLSILRCTDRARSERLADTLPARREFAPLIARLGESFAALARGDSARALALFTAFPDSLCPDFCWNIALTRGRLLGASGQTREAYEQLRLRSHTESGVLRPFAVPLALERARAAQRVGDGEAEARWYLVVAENWAHADRALRPIVDEAHRALARLGRVVPDSVQFRR